MKQADMWLYIGVAVSGVMSTQFQTDEAMKYIQPELLFFLRVFFGACAAGFLAAKMYRSTTYADSISATTQTVAGEKSSSPVAPVVQPGMGEQKQN